MTPEDVEAFIAQQGLDPNGREAYELRQQAAGPGEMAPTAHTPYWKELLKNAPMIFGPGLGAAGLEALVGPASQTLGQLGGLSGSAQGAVSGYEALPSLSAPVTSVSSASLPGATALGAAPAPGLSAPVTAASSATLPGKTALGAAPKSAWGFLNNKWVQKGLEVGAAYAGGKLVERSQNKAIDKALAAQEASAKQAQAQIDKERYTSGQVYNQQRADYQNLANQPYQKLGSLLGLSIGDVGPAPFAPNPNTPYTPPVTPTTARSKPADVPSQGTAQPRMATLRDLNGIVAQPQQQTQSGYVRLRAPDGEEQDVDPRMVPIFMQRGAVRV